MNELLILNTVELEWSESQALSAYNWANSSQAVVVWLDNYHVLNACRV